MDGIGTSFGICM